mmetsp:Transcript_56979/g.112264  ORF Transcript_56979/g.112264 Transcript_56979/m.112264 type:complete len:87 (-) Transcript_56979:155-415(-)
MLGFEVTSAALRTHVVVVNLAAVYAFACRALGWMTVLIGCGQGALHRLTPGMDLVIVGRPTFNALTDGCLIFGWERLPCLTYLFCA